MKYSVIALTLSVVLAGPALAAPGDPRLIQGTLEWPPALSGGEPFIVLRGDDGRVYYADLMAAQRHVPGALSAGSHTTLLGLEGAKPHEIIAVALGSGDAAALSLALAQATPTAALTLPAPPSPAPAGVVPPAATAAPAAGPPARLEEGRPARVEEGRWGTLRGSVYAVSGQTLFLRRDDGRLVAVDISKFPSTGLRSRPGSSVAFMGVPVGNNFQATGFMETETGPSASPPAKPAR